jgi:hypothetical protein
MKRQIFAIPVYLIIVLAASVCLAEVSVNLKLDRSQTLLTDSVQLIVSVTGSRDSESTPVILGLENFDVRSTGTASRLEFINGKMTSGVDYTYFIMPQKTGKFQVGPARVQIKGKTYSSNTAGLRVVKSAEGKGGDRGPLFLTAELSKNTVYVEEQTIYILKLHLQRNVRNISLNLPEVENLIFKQIAKPVEYRSTLNGQNYQVLEVRYSLVPSRAGNYMVDPARMSMTVLQSRRRSNRSIFDDPFSSFASGRPASIASKSLPLTVQPLPEEGKPPDFSGLVGKFKMSSKLDPVRLKTGESATLTVSVSGEGNVNRIPDPKMTQLADVKIYADQPVLESTQDQSGLKGTKTMKWALVPEKEGLLAIPPVAVSFFDTENHAYKTLKSSSHTLTVLPGKKEEIAVSETDASALFNDGAVKQTVMELGRDIFPVHTAMQDFKTFSRLERENWVFGALLGLPLALYLASLCGMKLRRNSRAGRTDMMAKKAARVFFKRYHKSEHTAATLLLLVREYLNNRFSLSYGSLTPQEAFEILTSQGVGTETAEKMKITMQQLENAEYTGKGMEAAAVDTDLVPFIKRIEKESR